VPAERERPGLPPWCPAIQGSAACVLTRGHKGTHAGSDLDGVWRRWAEENGGENDG